MIDRFSRDRLALALRRYVSGHIHNDELDCVEVDWRDRGAVAVQQMAWRLYDDFEQHYATGKHQIRRDARREIARWIVFLQSDIEYLWPEYSFIQIINWPMNLLTFGWWERHKGRIWNDFCETGDFSSWPFQNAKEVSCAAATPKFFLGREHSK